MDTAMGRPRWWRPRPQLWRRRRSMRRTEATTMRHFQPMRPRQSHGRRSLCRTGAVVAPMAIGHPARFLAQGRPSNRVERSGKATRLSARALRREPFVADHRPVKRDRLARQALITDVRNALHGYATDTGFVCPMAAHLVSARA